MKRVEPSHKIAPKTFVTRCVMLAALVLLGLSHDVLALGGGTKEKLKAGGYVILMRYAQSQKGRDDPASVDLEKCETQRNLAEEGRHNTLQINERFERAGIKITRALSSRWCRAMDTAKLLAPAVVVEPRDELAAYLNRKEPKDRRAMVSKIRSEIASWKGPGNLLIVSHKMTIKAISGVALPEGGYIVVDPRTLKIIAEDY